MPTVVTMSGKVLVVDMLTRDFEGYRDAILGGGGLADTHTPKWTDRSELDLGVALTEGLAFMADNLSYYFDRCANEALWPSLTQRRSCVEQAALIDYVLKSAVSANVALTVTTSGSGTLPKGTQVSTDTSDGTPAKIFELEEEFVAPAAGVYPGVYALHGQTRSEVFDSDGSPSLAISLGSKPLTLTSTGSSSVSVRVVEGTTEFEWEEVSTFHESRPTDRHFRVLVDESDSIQVVFGTGVKGKRPPSGIGTVSVSYRTGGGPEGNEVGPNRLVKLVSRPLWVTSVTNPKAPTGGSLKESIEDAKVNAPKSLAALNRAVSHEDYESLAMSVPGVAKAKAFRGNGPLEEVVIIASKGDDPRPTGSWNPFTTVGVGLIGSVGQFLETRKTTPTIVRVRSVSAVPVWLTIEVFLHPKASKRAVKKAIEETLLKELHVQNFLMGVQLSESKVDDIVEEVPGVDYLNVLRLQRQPYFRLLVGSDAVDLTFDDILVGEKTVKDVWTVTFISSTDFEFRGKSSGKLPNGKIGVPYSAPSHGVNFKINAHTVYPGAGNKWEFITGAYRGNLDPQFYEATYLDKDRFFISLQGGVI